MALYAYQPRIFSRSSLLLYLVSSLYSSCLLLVWSGVIPLPLLGNSHRGWLGVQAFHYSPLDSSRLVAIADVHGDVRVAMRALTTAKIVDEHAHWIAGDTTLVQTGDLVDRGNASLAVLELFARLEEEAPLHGGRVVPLLGNHEWLCLSSDYRYASKHELAWLGENVPSGKASDVRPAVSRWLDNFLRLYAGGANLDVLDRVYTEEERPKLNNIIRQGADIWMDIFGSGGPYAQLLSSRRIATVEGKGKCRTLFVHAGLPESVVPKLYGTVDALNEAGGAMLKYHAAPRGAKPDAPSKDAKRIITGNDGPLWIRSWAMDRAARVCPAIETVVEESQVRRAVVGHTVQEEVTEKCHGHLTLLDVGMSDAYNPGGKPTVWECEDGQVRIVTPSGRKNFGSRHDDEL